MAGWRLRALEVERATESAVAQTSLSLMRSNCGCSRYGYKRHLHKAEGRIVTELAATEAGMDFRLFRFGEFS